MPFQARHHRSVFISAILASVLATAGCAGIKEKMGMQSGPTVSLEGSQEVPPVSTKATGKSTITVAPDKSVSGMVVVSAMQPTAAHIHEAARGANGPVIIPLRKTSDTSFSVPENTRLTDAQFQSFRDGKLYVNVHSAAHPGGELRAQLTPK